jgi:hypothetical protein
MTDRELVATVEIILIAVGLTAAFLTWRIKKK